MSVGNDSGHKVTSADHHVENSDSQSPSTIFIGLHFRLGKQPYRCVWTHLMRHRSPQPNQAAKDPDYTEQNVHRPHRDTIITRFVQSEFPPQLLGQ
jgi:hypothetical protein